MFDVITKKIFKPKIVKIKCKKERGNFKCEGKIKGLFSKANFKAVIYPNKEIDVKGDIGEKGKEFVRKKIKEKFMK